MSNLPRNLSASFRAFILAVSLLLASIFATGAATASPLVSAFDIGAPGGGGGAATASIDLATTTTPGIRVL